ncbi:transglycosylase domain-containing protein [Arthrobacter antibioticus]|uniref:transglycosylase domain-containing protein n=1 Tax=Arthrobacter sp. H35-MC1 TaxID=3046203 RepID=UPI0024BBAE72|nr:transglycosylase domain-containing protein [Arthrobacter sp. H35-MC1]MDJ0315637.1 transglycosylase domain-containing protein [Arthrobacter sp. H35-MC1]
MANESVKQSGSKNSGPWAGLLGADGTWANLGRFFLVCGVVGVLVAALFVPAGALATAAVGGADDFISVVPESLNFEAPSQATTVLAADGSTIATLYAQDRKIVDLTDMSPFIKNGVISIEDARFYEHGGVDPTGIARALLATINGGRQGASTITQQYVNNMLIEQLVSNGKTDEAKLGAEKTVVDKVKEIQLAIGLEKKMSKDDILAGYLNIIYFGNGAYGIEAASKLYFNTSAKDLTLAQAAVLAGVVNRPSYYDPITEPQHATQRRDDVLAKMLAHKKISKEEYDVALKTPLELQVTKSAQGCAAAASAPYFCDYVQQLILNSKAFGATPEERTKVLYQGGLTIKTTLDPALQKVAQEQASATMSATDPLQRGAAIVSVQPGTGKVLAMAQNTVFDPAAAPGNYMGNFALPVNDENGQPLHGAGGFQIGSTFKPFVFAEWLNSGHSMMTTINGAVRKYPTGYPWKNSCGPIAGEYDPAAPGSFLLPNDDPDHYYPMSAYQGLYSSINTITFQTATTLDFCNIQKIATAAGVKDGRTNKPYDVSQISSLIGTQNVAPLDMATAFATFASGGIRCTPIALTSITDAAGSPLPVPAPDCQRAITPEVAAGVSYALQSVLVRGSGYNIPLNDKSMAFAKTGTTDGNIDTWTIGATSGIATASWFGSYQGNGPEWVNQDIVINGRYFTGVDGADLAGGQWAAIMNAAAGNPSYAPVPFAQPPADMLAPTAPLIAGVTDPKPGDRPAFAQLPAQPPATEEPAKPQEQPTQAPAPAPKPAPQPPAPVEPAPAPTPSQQIPTAPPAAP